MCSTEISCLSVLYTSSKALLFFSHMNIQELTGNSLNAFFNSLQPQLFGNCSEQTAVETWQRVENKDIG